MTTHDEFVAQLDALKRARAHKAVVEESLKTVNENIKGLVYDIVEYMENTNQLSVKIKGLGMCSLTGRKIYSVDREDPIAAQAFETFVRNNNEWDLVTAVHAAKLNGYYKEKLELEEEVPPGVKTYIKNNITIRG